MCCASDWDCTLERRGDGGPQPAVRLGLRMVQSLSEATVKRLVAARRERAFADTEDLARRAAIGTLELQALARADALQGLAGHRRQQTWVAAGQELPARPARAEHRSTKRPSLCRRRPKASKSCSTTPRSA